MKYVLFLVFLETGVEPLAEYSTYEACEDAKTELQISRNQQSTNASDLMAQITLQTTAYSCLAVPKSYNLGK